MTDCITSMLLTLLVHFPFPKLLVSAEAFGDMGRLFDDVRYVAHDGECLDAADHARC